MRSYYNRRIPGQYEGVISRPSAGLNEYTPATAINDNFLSDILDGTPYREEAIEFESVASLTAGIFTTGNDGVILKAISIQNTENYALLVYNKTNETWHIRVTNITAKTLTNYTLTSYGLPITDIYSNFYSSCNFSTEVNQFVCFTCSYAKVLMFYDHKNTAVGKTTLPFYPKKIISHANRVFAIDTNNILWWCRAGDLYSWYGIEYDDDMLMASGDMKNGAYTLTAQPDVPRPVTATITKTSTIDTLGSLALSGTNFFDQAQSEDLVPIDGRVQSLKSYKTVAITGSGWTAVAGTDKISFGVAPVSSGYVQDDAGFWTLENEQSLTDICVLSNNIYIFGVDNIYVFRGYSYDTFTLNTIIPGLGIKESSTPHNWLATTNNMAYFFLNGDIYEFNGYDFPRLITHPIETNGQSSNLMFGGIETLTENYSIVADNNKLMIYDDRNLLFATNEYYEYVIRSKTWWKKSGYTKYNSVYSTSKFRLHYVVTYDTDSIIAFVSSDTTAGIFNYHTALGHKGSYNPYLVTKAFNSNPSEKQSLTALILCIDGDSTVDTDINVYYSKKMGADDFTLFKTYTSYVMTNDVQYIEIPLPIDILANQGHYRIKIEIDGYVMLYNIERRFRVKGYSR